MLKLECKIFKTKNELKPKSEHLFLWKFNKENKTISIIMIIKTFKYQDCRRNILFLIPHEPDWLSEGHMSDMFCRT